MIFRVALRKYKILLRVIQNQTYFGNFGNGRNAICRKYNAFILYFKMSFEILAYINIS